MSRNISQGFASLRNYTELLQLIYHKPQRLELCEKFSNILQCCVVIMGGHRGFAFNLVVKLSVELG
jgi:hypothetical protein